MKFYTQKDAEKSDLSPVTKWADDTTDERSYLEKESARILKNSSRHIMYVKRGTDGFIALFANAVSTTVKSMPRGRFKSVSGKYKNIQHLAEVLFSKNPKIDMESFKSCMKCEFPGSAPSKDDQCCNRYRWFRHQLVIQHRFQYIERPEWAK